MDNIKIKQEPRDEEEITIEYNDLCNNKSLHLESPKFEDNISDNQPITPVKTERLCPGSKHDNRSLNQIAIDRPNIETHENIKNLPCNRNVPLHSKAKVPLKSTENDKSKPSISQNRIPSSSNTESNTDGDNFSLPFEGVKYMHTQVHSNSVLQLLLKDIVNLNNENDLENDDVDEDIIRQEIEKLRSKNNLPSFTVEDYFSDSDSHEGSEDESCSNHGSKGSESNGKDSGYENESQHSESVEDENQEDNRNEADKNLDEPEYIDLDNYFGAKNKRSTECFNGSLAEIRNIARNSHEDQNIQLSDERTSVNLTCPKCSKTFQTINTYIIHIQLESGCLKKKSEQTKNRHCESIHKNKLIRKEELIKPRHKLIRKEELFKPSCEENSNVNSRAVKNMNNTGCLTRIESETSEEALVAKKSELTKNGHNESIPRSKLSRKEELIKPSCKENSNVNSSAIKNMNNTGCLTRTESETYEDNVAKKSEQTKNGHYESIPRNNLSRKEEMIEPSCEENSNVNSSAVKNMNNIVWMKRIKSETCEEASVEKKSEQTKNGHCESILRNKLTGKEELIKPSCEENSNVNSSAVKNMNNIVWMKRIKSETCEDAFVEKKSEQTKNGHCESIPKNKLTGKEELIKPSCEENSNVNNSAVKNMNNIVWMKRIKSETCEDAFVEKKSEQTKNGHCESIHKNKLIRKEELIKPKCEENSNVNSSAVKNMNNTVCLKRIKSETCEEALVEKKSEQTKNGHNVYFNKNKLIRKEELMIKPSCEENSNVNSSAVKNMNLQPRSCRQCRVTFFTNETWEKHSKKCSKQKMACMRCDLVFDRLNEYHLHILKKHVKAAKRKHSECEDVEIVEIDDSDGDKIVEIDDSDGDKVVEIEDSDGDEIVEIDDSDDDEI